MELRNLECIISGFMEPFLLIVGAKDGNVTVLPRSCANWIDFNYVFSFMWANFMLSLSGKHYRSISRLLILLKLIVCKLFVDD